MTEGERRKLTFANLLNGVPVGQIMVAFGMSEKEVMDDFRFVAAKIRSYRFERGMPLFPTATIAECREAKVELLYALQRVNADKDPVFSRIETLPFEPGNRGSQAELKLMEINSRRRGA